MPRISFTFSGTVDKAHINKAYDEDGKIVDVSKMTSEELSDKLNAGDLTISFEKACEDCEELDVEMIDYESKD